MSPDQFRAWRIRLGLSLTGAAELLGVSRRAVAMYQAPATSSSRRDVPGTIARLCIATETLADLGVDIATLRQELDEIVALEAGAPVIH